MELGRKPCFYPLKIDKNMFVFGLNSDILNP